MDIAIQNTQKWLNQTYGLVPGWVPVSETGMTGWDTIYGLRRALQSEIGISPVASGFGDATIAAFKSRIGRIDISSNTPRNILKILSGGLWCKGREGFYENSAESFDTLSGSVAGLRADLGLGNSQAYVDVKLMAFILSMDAATIPFFSTGTTGIREIQQWLNFKLFKQG